MRHTCSPSTNKKDLPSQNIQKHRHIPNTRDNKRLIRPVPTICHRIDRTIRYQHLDRGTVRSKMSTMVSGYPSRPVSQPTLSSKRQTFSLMSCKLYRIDVPAQIQILRPCAAGAG